MVGFAFDRVLCGTEISFTLGRVVDALLRDCIDSIDRPRRLGDAAGLFSHSNSVIFSFTIHKQVNQRTLV